MLGPQPTLPHLPAAATEASPVLLVPPGAELLHLASADAALQYPAQGKARPSPAREVMSWGVGS